MFGTHDEPTDPPDDDLEWVDVEEPEPESPRRRKVLAVALVALLTVTGLPLFSGGAVAQTSFTAQDVTLTTNGGTVQSLTVQPAGNVSYDGLESQPSSVDLAVQVNVDGTWETVTTDSVSASGLEGSVSYNISEVDLLSNSGLTQADFTASDGASNQTTVDVRVRATLVGAGPGGADVVANGSDSFTVTVDNQAAGASVGGQANTGGTGK